MVRMSFAAIRNRRPRRLYLIADGPRPTHPEDLHRCQEARAIVDAMLDWPCEVVRDYSEINLGCRRRVSSGLTSAFSRLGETIVLEDDLLPHPDFFDFCAKFLEQYRDTPEVHSICGFNPFGKFLPAEGRVVPTRINSVWGWASWQRAWKTYRANMEGWTDAGTREALRGLVSNDLYFNDKARGFDEVLKGTLNTWDYPWTYTLLAERRVALVSPVNLILNAGFTPDATHTTDAPPPYLRNLHSYAASSTISAPLSLTPDNLFDRLAPLIVLTSSWTKVALLRLLCRTSRSLVRCSLN